MRRTAPESRSGIPGTALKLRLNWMPLIGKTDDCRPLICAYNGNARGRYPTMTTPRFAAIGRPHSPAHRALYYGLLAVLCSVTIGVAAQFQIPFYPVPVTLQTLAVLIIGGAFGARLGAA